MTLQARPLQASPYAPYGSVIAAGPSPGRVANQGRARVWDRLADLVDLRPGVARPNVSVFRTGPWEGTMCVRLLERHPRSTQAFVPMTARRYLVVVALGDRAPDLRTLAAFLAGPAQGITYRPGVWHHPLVALDAVADFACLCWEAGTEQDCERVDLDQEVEVSYSS